jgi:hypothetical protein
VAVSRLPNKISDLFQLIIKFRTDTLTLTFFPGATWQYIFFTNKTFNVLTDMSNPNVYLQLNRDEEILFIYLFIYSYPTPYLRALPLA